MKLPHIYLARHGQTEWSLSGQYTGRTDIRLTAEGEREAETLGVRLRTLGVKHVLCSPLIRARRTCEIGGFAPTARFSPDLLEWDYGDYEGLRTAQIRETNPTWNIFRDGCPHGENTGDVTARADRVIAEIRKADEDTLIFAHGHLLRVFVARWIGLPGEAGALFSLGTASLSTLSYDHGLDEPVLKSWNDRSHLQGKVAQ